jgi:hypothetical protein
MVFVARPPFVKAAPCETSMTPLGIYATADTTTCDRPTSDPRDLKARALAVELGAATALIDTTRDTGSMTTFSRESQATASGKSTVAPSISRESAQPATATTTETTSLFAKLPGELRNRTYRLHFETAKSETELRIAVKGLIGSIQCCSKRWRRCSSL